MSEGLLGTVGCKSDLLSVNHEFEGSHRFLKQDTLPHCVVLIAYLSVISQSHCMKALW